MENATEIADASRYLTGDVGGVMPPAYTVEELGIKLDALIASHNRILALMESLESQFGPVLDGMRSGPIGKLMGL